MRSLSARLNIGLAISLVLVFLVLGAATTWALRTLIESHVDSRVEHDAEGLLSALDMGRDLPMHQLRPGRISPIYQRVYSGHYYQIVIGERMIRSRSLWDYSLTLPAVAPGEVVSGRVAGPDGQLLWLRTAAYRKQDRTVVIAVAEDLTPIRDDVRRMQLGFIVVSVAALLILLLVQWRVLRSGLAPLHDTCTQLAELAAGARESLDESVPAEIHPLVQAFNRQLHGMRQRLLRSRHALGNLAHALKTPLTLIAQIGARPELDHNPDIQSDLHTQVERLRHLMDRELRRAQLAGGGAVTGQVDLPAELRGLVAVLERLYARRQLHIEIDVPPSLKIAADREDMLELFGNLLDNACKWAQQRVRVSLSGRAGFEAVIEDDGPGVPESEREQLTQRGTRIDESTTGHGLGLAIAQDIVEQYGGELHLMTSAAFGGLAVVVRLPV